MAVPDDNGTIAVSGISNSMVRGFFHTIGFARDAIGPDYARRLHTWMASAIYYGSRWRFEPMSRADLVEMALDAHIGALGEPDPLVPEVRLRVLAPANRILYELGEPFPLPPPRRQWSLDALGIETSLLSRRVRMAYGWLLMSWMATGLALRDITEHSLNFDKAWDTHHMAFRTSEEVAYHLDRLPWRWVIDDVASRQTVYGPHVRSAKSHLGGAWVFRARTIQRIAVDLPVPLAEATALWDRCCDAQREALSATERKWWKVRLLADTDALVKPLPMTEVVPMRDDKPNQAKLRATVNTTVEAMARAIADRGDVGDPTPLLDMSDDSVRIWG